MIQDEPLGLSLEPDRSCRHSIGIHASPAEVYQALTDPDLLRRWFVADAEIDLRPGGAYRWIFGPAIGDPNPETLVTTGEFLSVSKQELLRLKAMVEEAETEVEFRIDPWADGAILTVTHSGFPGDEEWDDTFRALDRGWQTEVHVLKLYLEHGRGLLRHAERHERRLEADPEMIFDAFTTSAGIAGWLADRAAADATPGGELRLEWNGRGVSGHYAVCDPDRFLLMTWEDEPPSLIRVWIEEEEGAAWCGLKVDHISFGPGQGENVRFDWPGALARLQAALKMVRTAE
jgi:uncharacterized protein YndB with AHSA1/START domain